MVYVLWIATILLMAIKGYCGKKTSVYMHETGDAILFSLARMLFCVVTSLGLVFVETSQQKLVLEPGMLAICVLSGASNAAFVIGWMLAVRKNAMVTVDVTMTLDSLIPAVLCALFFGQAISWQKMIGFAVILMATLIMSGYRTTGKPGALGILMLVVASLGEGMVGFSQQLYNQYYTEIGICAHGVYYPLSVYQFYTYAVTVAILLPVFGIYAAKKRLTIKSAKNLLIKPLPHIFIMAVCLFAVNSFQTLITGRYGMPSQILYPVLKGSGLITVTITAMLFFGEKPTKRSIFGSVTAFVGVIIMKVI